MTYGNIPLIIPILATGYLLTVYLLLALAERTVKDKSSTRSASTNRVNKPEAIAPKVTAES
ncbi:MAG: hypothetical protein H0X31_18200 [Nostocaceae cyanobacterium]|nr:hypothetical protein [Nostocaceae cyanobacterium]